MVGGHQIKGLLTSCSIFERLNKWTNATEPWLFFYFLLCCNGRVLQHVRLVRFVQFSFESGNNSTVRKSSRPTKKREALLRIQPFVFVRIQIWKRIFPLMRIRIRFLIKLIRICLRSSLLFTSTRIRVRIRLFTLMRIRILIPLFTLSESGSVIPKWCGSGSPRWCWSGSRSGSVTLVRRSLQYVAVTCTGTREQSNESAHCADRQGKYRTKKEQVVIKHDRF